MNHLMYADDLVVLSPSSAGLQQLLSVCSVYGVENDIKYNANKSVVLICCSKEDQTTTVKEQPKTFSSQLLEVESSASMGILFSRMKYFTSQFLKK